MKHAYITRIEKYLPNEPISNEEMETYLGLVNGNTSKARSMILRSNQIKTRYYALDKSGNPTHTNAQLTAEAIRKLFDDTITLQDIDLLTAGTSSPDTIQPSHALMVQGELNGNEAMEVMSAHGTCNAAMLSLKYAYMAVLSGMAKNAVCAGSETFSSWMHARNYEKEIDRRKELEQNPYIAFEKDFLRWMLSDGASALLLQDKPNSNGISLKVDWIEVRSFAHELDACMYAGCTKDKNGKVQGWREMDAESQYNASVFSLKQDAKLLQEFIVPKGGDVLQELISTRGLDIDSIDYFLPHISSMFFKAKIQEHFEKSGFGIPFEKWLLNLERIGNVGAASPLFLIEELFHSGKLKNDDKILVMVPESARFSYAYMLLTAVSS